jgi:hypothetical protein
VAGRLGKFMRLLGGAPHVLSPVRSGFDAHVSLGGESPQSGDEPLTFLPFKDPRAPGPPRSKYARNCQNSGRENSWRPG